MSIMDAQTPVIPPSKEDSLEKIIARFQMVSLPDFETTKLKIVLLLFQS
jgi:hypothetical protein